ncbi:phosphopantetheine-binding protein [Parabacteroides sp.]
MDIQGFIEKFAEAIEVEDTKKLSENTEFRSLDEWSSLAAIVVIAMFDEEYDKELKIADFKRAVTIGDLFNLLK